jgi:transcriptional regulator with PAS, ATPase and Fis domain
MALGTTKRRRVDVRVLAATNRELSAIRPDVMARLGPEAIRLPPLKQHLEDLAALAGHFLRDWPGLGLEVRAFQALCLHAWPDNVRGLKKAMERAAELAKSEGKDLIGVEHLPDWFNRRPVTMPPTSTKPSDLPPGIRRSPRAAPTKEELATLLEKHDWVVARVARELDRDHAVVWRWIKRYRLEVPDPSGSDSEAD